MDLVNLSDWFSNLEQHLDAPPAPPTATPRTGIALVPYIGPQRPGDAYNARHIGRPGGYRGAAYRLGHGRRP